MLRKVGILFFLMGVFLFAQNGKEIFFNFEKNTEIWKKTSTKGNCVDKISISDEKSIDGKKSLKVDFNLPGEGCIESSFFKDLSVYKNLILNIYIPKSIPEDFKLCVFLQDNEWLWYQTPLFDLLKGKWNRLTIDVRPESPFWENIGHNQPWSIKSLSSIRKIGIKFFSNSKFKGSIYIDKIEGEMNVFPEYTINKKKVKKYEKIEISFNLPFQISNPFDPSQVLINGVFINPDDEEIKIPAFYYQKYGRKIVDDEEALYPVGYPYWKIRFTPCEEGNWKFYISVKIKDKELKSNLDEFLVIPSEKKGFIRISEIDKRFFSFSDGSFFYPVGINIRSPTDVRYLRLVKKEYIPDEGTYYYEEYFKKMKENGMNFIEMWLACWFAGLEWKENRPGYKGIGFYNLRNAWKVDKILEMAEESGIYIQLVIINHGQLSTWCDKEWQDNPYNIKNGGFLKKPEEFFTNEKAKNFFKNELRYIVARWGYSPNIFSWEILNEMNLVGSKRRFFRKKTMGRWIEEMKEYIKNIDPYKHLVSAHYTCLVNNKVVKNYVDYVITNAYYNIKRASLTRHLDRIYRYNSKYGKPNFVSEYGGNPHGATFENLKRDLILGIWYSFHKNFAAVPLFWWHRFVYDYNLFYVYKNLSDYASDIDRIKIPLSDEKVEIKGKGKEQLYYSALGNKFFSTCFIYDFSLTRNVEGKNFSEFSHIKAGFSNKKDGKYRIEIFNIESGEKIEKEKEAESGKIFVDIPSFKKWIAVKIIYNE